MFKIYFIEYDENGNEIRRDVHHGKIYKYQGTAWNAARKLYGDSKRYEFYICERAPWEEYSHEAVCELCGEHYAMREHMHGYDCGQRVYISDHRHHADFYTRNDSRRYDRPRRSDTYDVCPACYEKITNFINGLKVGE